MTQKQLYERADLKKEERVTIRSFDNMVREFGFYTKDGNEYPFGSDMGRIIKFPRTRVFYSESLEKYLTLKCPDRECVIVGFSRSVGGTGAYKLSTPLGDELDFFWVPEMFEECRLATLPGIEDLRDKFLPEPKLEEVI